MPVSISVGPPVVTISQGSSFMVTAQDGQILADSDQGVFADDTRFVSYLRVRTFCKKTVGWHRV